MIGKIAYASAVGLTLGFVLTFHSGCAGGRLCVEATRIDAVTETKKTYNGSFGEFWNGIVGKTEKTNAGRS